MSDTVSISQLRAVIAAYDAGSDSEGDSMRDGLQVLLAVASTALDLSDAGKAFEAERWNGPSRARGQLERAACDAETFHLAALAKVTR